MDPGFPYVALFSTIYLTLDTVVALIRAHHDTSEVGLVLSGYVPVVSLILLVHAYERSQEGSERRKRLKIPIWTFLTVLLVTFAHRVSTILPFVWVLLVWIMVGFITLIGYFFFFIYPISATVAHRYMSESGMNQSSPEEEV